MRKVLMPAILACCPRGGDVSVPADRLEMVRKRKHQWRLQKGLAQAHPGGQGSLPDQPIATTLRMTAPGRGHDQTVNFAFDGGWNGSDEDFEDCLVRLGRAMTRLGCRTCFWVM